MLKHKFKIISIVCSLLAMIAAPSLAYAQQSKSTNYGVNEVFFGSGGLLNGSSTNYQAQQSVGELGIGNPKSSNYQARAGFNTNDTPLLELTVNGGLFVLGQLTTTATAYQSTTFSVRNYLSKGYVVEVRGTPPSQPGHTLAPMTLGNPTPGTDQFGINLAANTNPLIGSSPTQQPDSSFSFGQATSNYNQINKFMYQDGDTIASSTKSSGQTTYTMSYVANVSSTTPAGTYNGIIDLIAVPTF